MNAAALRALRDIARSQRWTTNLSQTGVELQCDAIHRRDKFGRCRERSAPAGFLVPVQYTQRHQRINFIEAIEGEDGDVHGIRVWCRLARGG